MKRHGRNIPLSLTVDCSQVRVGQATAIQIPQNYGIPGKDLISTSVYMMIIQHFLSSVYVLVNFWVGLCVVD